MPFPSDDPMLKRKEGILQLVMLLFLKHAFRCSSLHLWWKTGAREARELGI